MVAWSRLAAGANTPEPRRLRRGSPGGGRIRCGRSPCGPKRASRLVVGITCTATGERATATATASVAGARALGGLVTLPIAYATEEICDEMA